MSLKYSGTFAIQHLSYPTKIYVPKVFLLAKIKLEYSDILWHPTTIYVPKVFLLGLTKIKPEYSDILNNPTHSPGLLVCQIRQVSTVQCIYLPYLSIVYRRSF